MNNIKKRMLPAIFMHIQKTAGTSIVNIAQTRYGLENVISHNDYLKDLNNNTVGAAEFYKKENIFARHHNTLFISGHFNYRYCSALMQDRYSFTFLRDPAERVLSFYYYCLAHPNHNFDANVLANKHTFEDFLKLAFSVPEISARVYNYQVRHLTSGHNEKHLTDSANFPPRRNLEEALENISTFSFVGTAENFKHDMRTILRDLKIRRPLRIPHRNSTPNRPRVEDLPPSTLRLLRDMTAVDQALYDHVTQRKKRFFSFFPAFISRTREVS